MSCDTYISLSNVQSSSGGSGTSGTDLTLSGDLVIGGSSTFSGPLKITDTTQSNNQTTGALIVSGGVGIKKNLYTGGENWLQGPTHIAGSTTQTGSLTIGSGPFGVGNATYINGRSIQCGQLKCTDINGLSTFGGTMRIIDTTQTTNLTTGALIVSGGVGITKDVFIGGNLNVTGTITPSSGFTATDKTANYTAVSGDWVIYDLSAATAGSTLTLPATPSQGDEVRVTLGVENASPSTIYVSIGRNGSSINGSTSSEAETLNILWQSGDTVTFRANATSKWVTTDRTISNRFLFQAERTSAQSINASTQTRIAYTTENFDPNGDFDNVTNFDYTVPVSGKYLVNSITRFTAINDGVRVYVAMKVGGVDNGCYGEVTTGVGSSNPSVSINNLFEFTAGDVVAMNAYHTDSGAKDISACYFSMNLVGSAGSDGGSGGGKLTQTSTKSAAYTAVSGDEVLCDTNAAAGDFDITLPASPNAGDVVRIVLITDHATRDVKIDRNGSNWMGSTAADIEDRYMLCLEGDSVTVKYMGGGVGWSVIDDSIQIHKAYMRPATQTTTLTTGNLIKLVYDTSVYDKGGLVDLTNEQFTIRRTGEYFVKTMASMVPTAAGVQVELFIWTSAGQCQSYNYGFNGYSTCETSKTIVLTEGDTVIFYLRHNDATSPTSRTDLSGNFAQITEIRN